MVILTVSTSFDMDSFIDAVRQVEGVTSVFVSYQADPKNDQVLGDEVVHKWGRQNIQDVVCGTICQVSPKTFMQANAMLVNTLYQTLMKSLNVQGELVDFIRAGVLTVLPVLCSSDWCR